MRPSPARSWQCQRSAQRRRRPTRICPFPALSEGANCRPRRHDRISTGRRCVVLYPVIAPQSSFVLGQRREPRDRAGAPVPTPTGARQAPGPAPGSYRPDAASAARPGGPRRGNAPEAGAPPAAAGRRRRAPARRDRKRRETAADGDPRASSRTQAPPRPAGTAGVKNETESDIAARSGTAGPPLRAYRPSGRRARGCA